MSITQKLVQQLFEYKDGQLFRKVAQSKNIKIGQLAGYLNQRGYRSIRINNKAYFAHRLIFLYHYGYLPKYLDHIDGNPLNNKIENLREATLSQNQGNSKLRQDNKSGHKGVTWYKRYQKWRAQLRIKDKKKHLGFFSTKEEAALAYNKAASQYFGEFAKVNEISSDNIVKGE